MGRKIGNMHMNEYSNQKLTGYNHDRGLQYIRLHLKKYRLLMSTFISPDLKLFEKMRISADFVGCVVKYGAGINDYFQYNFYKRPASERKNFIVARKWKHMIKVCNGQVRQKLFDDKSRFNETYSEYLGRDWIDIDQCSYEEFVSFTEKHRKSMYKIKGGSGGNGIGIFETGLNADLKAAYNLFRNKHVIFEEILIQHKETAKFNPSSVNTIRLVTIVRGNRVFLMNAVFRMGNGKGCTDNFHHYGLAALVDTETGAVYTPAVDKKNRRYTVHPLSKEKITGYTLPYWEEIVKKVKEAALVTPKVRYVGWDVAIKADGNICIIEGNCASDPDIIQMPDQLGKWQEYKKVIHSI